MKIARRPTCPKERRPTNMETLGKHGNLPTHGKSLRNTGCRPRKPNREIKDKMTGAKETHVNLRRRNSRRGAELIFGRIERMVEDAEKTEGLTKTQFKDWGRLGKFRPGRKEEEEGS